MNLDELKGVWNTYDDQLKATDDISPDIIEGMVREKSGSVVSRIHKSYRYGIFIAGFYILCFIAIILGNAFDYEHIIEFLPISLMLTCFVVLIILLLRARAGLKNTALYQQSPMVYLEEVIKAYRKPQQFLSWILALSVITGSILIPMTFLPRKLVYTSIWRSLLEVYSPLVIIGVYFLVRKKMGQWDKEKWYGFKANMEELNKLKVLASELKD